jgi:Antitoxin ParD
MSRLTIDLTDTQHQSIKAMAALQGKSIKQFAVERLFSDLPDEEKALVELKALLQQRLAESARGEVVAQSITKIAHDAIKASNSV